MQSMKQTAANVAASAKSGMEKTKAVVQEKVEKITANDAMEKEMAKEKKHDRIQQAELHKHEAHEQNAAARQASRAGESHSYTAAGQMGQPTGTQEMSEGSAHKAGDHNAPVTEGTVESHPMPRGGGASTGHGTGSDHSG